MNIQVPLYNIKTNKYIGEVIIDNQLQTGHHVECNGKSYVIEIKEYKAYGHEYQLSSKNKK